MSSVLRVKICEKKSSQLKKQHTQNLMISINLKKIMNISSFLTEEEHLNTDNFKIYDNFSPFLIQIALIVVAVTLFTVIFLQVQFKPSLQGYVGKIICFCGSLLVIYLGELYNYKFPFTTDELSLSTDLVRLLRSS